MRNIVEHGQTSGSSDEDRLVGVLARQPLHHVDLRCRRRAPRPPARRVDPFLDPLGRADPVGELDDVVRALGVHDHFDAGMLGAGRGDVLGPEALVHRAVALPEQQRRFLDVALLEPAEVLVRVPHRHVARR